ncbi:MAG: phosphomannomutase [Sphingobium sp.]|uniref:phosphoglucomutase/phosphomannomutase PgmG n=1 Tax=Sphingobium sp. TaxID=1912891 RepID=UPI000DB2FA11|nr:phosphomannomutase/phosphoglucomutase [Sphingobium sp.]PZU14432.1 MAG: phosphomannomutase [Sphingobium sp.]
MSHLFHPAVLREYDVRGTVGKTLHEADARAIGRSFATVVARAGGRRLAVGYDGRISSPMLERALVDGVTQAGIDVVRIGLGPTPMLYHAEMTGDVDGGIQITGSHNPADQNGFKLVHAHAPFFGADIQRLGDMAARGDWDSGSGRIESADMLEPYVARLMQGFDGRPLRVGWDAGNGAAGPAVEQLTQRLPGEHHLLFTQVDGRFPHHHPDPAVDANLADLRALVLSRRLDFGVAFDGDGDRIGVIDAEGRAIAGDRLLGIFAADMVRAHPDARIVGDVKTSQTIFDRIAAVGGQPDMWKAGHSHIKSRMKQIGAVLGGETTGHLFFADDHPGYDDALYAAVRLIRLLSASARPISALAAAMPTGAITPELHIAVPDEAKFGIVDAVATRLRRAGADVVDLDGLRVRTADGWWLLRASNTQGALVVRAEGRDAAALANLLAEVESHLADTGLSLPTGP